MGQSLTKVAACTGTALNLAATTVADVGGTHPERSCTSMGCLFGPPLPIPNPASPPTSVCVINAVAADASGTADCSSGASAVSPPLTSILYLDGDLFPPDASGDHCVGGTNPGAVCTANATCTGGGFCSVGVQVCPICAGDGKCHGGANDGGACTPADSPLNASFPTSHDCAPPATNNIGSLPIAFALTTGTTTMTAGNYNANAQCTAAMQPFNCCTGAGAGTCVGQNNASCGFCRDSNAKGTGAKTGCFEGDPAAACPHNAACTMGPPTPQPFRCCTGAGTGTCDQPTFKACSVGGVTVAACTDGNGAWPDCEQRDAGAFGPGESGAQTITETGVPARAVGAGQRGRHARRPPQRTGGCDRHVGRNRWARMGQHHIASISASRDFRRRAVLVGQDALTGSSPLTVESISQGIQAPGEAGDSAPQNDGPWCARKAVGPRSPAP